MKKKRGQQIFHQFSTQQVGRDIGKHTSGEDSNRLRLDTDRLRSDIS